MHTQCARRTGERDRQREKHYGKTQETLNGQQFDVYHKYITYTHRRGPQPTRTERIEIIWSIQICCRNRLIIVYLYLIVPPCCKNTHTDTIRWCLFLTWVIFENRHVDWMCFLYILHRTSSLLCKFRVRWGRWECRLYCRTMTHVFCDDYAMWNFVHESFVLVLNVFVSVLNQIESQKKSIKAQQVYRLL